jgi:hypothetical protein
MTSVGGSRSRYFRHVLFDAEEVGQ